ncbi:hypothetical protein ACVR0S_09475 [Streptococcus dentapri]|uniref:DUF5082 domain-containing protein n=1 Tax=Streptococcus dentapri TaxID=573564 RepID=A0ABV8D201_9STRE
MSDSALKEKIYANNTKKKQYEKVCNAILENGLASQNDLSDANNLIDKCKDYIEKIDGNDGYGYLSKFRDKLDTQKKTIKKYRDFVRDSNKAFVTMYKDLTDEISSLESAIESDRSSYNKGKSFGDQIHWWNL